MQQIMARIFNIYFTHRGETHNGIVTMRKTPFFYEYTLDFAPELMDQLPGNKIISTSPDHFVFHHASTVSNTALMQAVLHAVASHLQGLEV
jgi:hypothetical protein